MAQVFGKATLTGPLSYTIGHMRFNKGETVVVTKRSVWEIVVNNSYFNCEPASVPKVRINPGSRAVPLSELKNKPEEVETEDDDDTLDDDEDTPSRTSKPHKPKSKKGKKSGRKER